MCLRDRSRGVGSFYLRELLSPKGWVSKGDTVHTPCEPQVCVWKVQEGLGVRLSSVVVLFDIGATLPAVVSGT